MRAPEGWTLKTWGDVVAGVGDVEWRLHELSEAVSSATPPGPEQLLAMVERARAALDFVQAAAAWDRASA